MERLKTLNLYNEEHTIEIERFQVTKDENKESFECYLACGLYWETREGKMVFDTAFDIDAIIKIQGEKSALLQINRGKEIHREELMVQKEKNNLHILVKE